ncbi:MAG: hypothetical protein R3D57_20135 [Hyphomicrobiaceae bacterium]
MARQIYSPPKQSMLGQTIDSLFLLFLVFVALFVPLWLGLAGGGKTTLEFADKSWTGLGQNATMSSAWEQLGYTPETATEIIASRFDYSFDPIAMLITAVVVIGYFYILVHFSRREYRDVIAERFDK